MYAAYHPQNHHIDEQKMTLFHEIRRNPWPIAGVVAVLMLVLRITGPGSSVLSHDYAQSSLREAASSSPLEHDNVAEKELQCPMHSPEGKGAAGRHVILSSVSSGNGWSMEDCSMPIQRAKQLINVISMFPDMEYVIIGENCPPRNITDRIHLISTLLPPTNGAESPALWSSRGKFLGYRFLEFYEYLKENEDIEYVLLADAWDTRVVAHPFAAMRARPGIDLFVQQEWRKVSQSEYMEIRMRTCLTPDMYESWADKMILNCGLWGGKRYFVLKVLEMMKDVYYKVITSTGKEECFKLGVDMVVFNHIFYDLLDEDLRQKYAVNEPLCPVFRNCAYIYHISDMLREVSPRAECSQPHPTLMDPTWSRSQADSYASGVCTQGGPPEVRCDKLPFAMIHKGEVIFD